MSSFDEGVLIVACFCLKQRTFHICILDAMPVMVAVIRDMLAFYKPSEPCLLLVVYAGIGSIPDAVLCKLTNHRDLGIHTEMFSDGIIKLVELGVVTNARKVIEAGKIVGGFAFGTKSLYDFMDNNPFVGE